MKKNCCCATSHPPLGVPSVAIKPFSGAVAGEEKHFDSFPHQQPFSGVVGRGQLQGLSLTLNLFVLFFVLFSLFILFASLYQKHKKNSSYYSCYFYCSGFNSAKMSVPAPITMLSDEMIFTFKQGSEESFKEAWSRVFDSYSKSEPRITLS